MPDKKEIKFLVKAFLILFLAFFLIFNWGKVSWLFNYKAVSITLSRIFSKERKPITNIAPIPLTTPEEEKFEFTEKENSLEIPSVEIVAPISFGKKH